MALVRNISARFGIFKRAYSVCTTSQANNNKMPTLYGDEVSPPVRFVMMTASHLGIKLDFHKIDLFLGKNKTEFYSKVNPMQKVPALETGNGIICDSHAIALYLCRQSKDTDLYPEETYLRAKVDEMLFFNSSNFFPVDSAIFTEYFAGKPIDSSKVHYWHKLLDVLDQRLKTNSWLTCDKMTLGDLCCAATISSLGVLVPLTDRHHNVSEWIKRLEKVPCFEMNFRGLERLLDVTRKMGNNIS